MSSDLTLMLFSPAPISSHKYVLLRHCLRRSVVYMLFSSQIRPACPCSKKRLVLQRQWPSLQGEGSLFLRDSPIWCKSITSAVCVQHNWWQLSSLIMSVISAYNWICQYYLHAASSAETTLICSSDEKELELNMITQGHSYALKDLILPQSKWSVFREAADVSIGWLIMTSGVLSPHRVRGRLPRWVSPWQGDEQARQTDWNVYISLSLWACPLTQNHTPPQALMKRDEAGRSKGVLSIHWALVISIEGLKEGEGRFWSLNLTNSWYLKKWCPMKVNSKLMRSSLHFNMTDSNWVRFSGSRYIVSPNML